MSLDLLNRRFIAVVGKGGTGKTLVSAALAVLAASRGKRVLVAMAQAKERLSAMLETEIVGARNQNILHNIDAVNMDPDVCLEEYGVMILRVRALYKAVMDNRLVKGFLRAVPGMDAWSMLGKALFHAKEMVDGQRRYDLVILDAPATGHGLQMLQVPQVICDVAPPGLLRREAEDGIATLRDPRASGVVVVTIPEEMPTAETEELIAKLEANIGVSPSALVINQVLAPMFEPRGEAAVRAIDALENAGPFAPLGHTMRSRLTREKIQSAMMQRLQEIDTPRFDLPMLAVERLQRQHVEQMARVLGAAGM